MEKSIMVRLKKGKVHFEVMTHHGAVELWRAQKLGWDKVCTADVVFTDSKKGQRASEAELLEAFGTHDMNEALRIICEKGEVQQNADDRKKAMSEKRLQVIHYLAKYYLDPTTKKPHPVAHLENAIEHQKVRIDLDTPVDEIVKKAMPKLLEVIKLKRSEIEGKLTVPHAVIGQAQASIRKYCQVRNEDYTGEGCVMQVALTPGDFDVFMKELGGVTKGDFQFDIDGMHNVAGATEEGNNNNAKKGGGKKGGGGGKKK